jgi:hypothetical protein
MTRSILCVMMLGVIACHVAQAADPEETSRRVTVTAEGIDRDDALRQALRKALEQGAGTQIAAFSEVEHFTLIRDTIYSRATGLVTDYDILKESSGAGGTVILEVAATVKPSVVAATWGAVQNALDQIGRPRMMVVINESIDHQRQPDSIVAARIEEMFTKAGFEMLDRKALIAQAAESGEDIDDADRLPQIAKRAGAHILIQGTANANRAGLEDLWGVPAAFYNCDVLARVYWTDTAKLITSESLPTVRQGVRSRREFSPQAARKALVTATFPDRPTGRHQPLAERLFESVLSQWATQVTAGGEVVLTVADLSFRDYVALRKELAELERVERVDAEFSSGSARYRLRTTRRAEELAERLLEPPFAKLLEVSDLSANAIKARAAGD